MIYCRPLFYYPYSFDMLKTLEARWWQFLFIFFCFKHRILQPRVRGPMAYHCASKMEVASSNPTPCNKKRWNFAMKIWSSQTLAGQGAAAGSMPPHYHNAFWNLTKLYSNFFLVPFSVQLRYSFRTLLSTRQLLAKKKLAFAFYRRGRWKMACFEENA